MGSLFSLFIFANQSQLLCFFLSLAGSSINCARTFQEHSDIALERASFGGFWEIGLNLEVGLRISFTPSCAKLEIMKDLLRRMVASIEMISQSLSRASGPVTKLQEARPSRTICACRLTKSKHMVMLMQNHKLQAQVCRSV